MPIHVMNTELFVVEANEFLFVSPAVMWFLSISLQLVFRDSELDFIKASHQSYGH